jgi:hypothetical protein
MPTRTCLSLGVLVALLSTPFARATSDLEKELAVLAGQIQKEVAKYSNAVSVGEFTGPRELASSGGPGIAKTLKTELEKLGVTVARSAEVAVKGEYRIVTDVDSNMTALAILARLTDRSGKELLQMDSRAIFDMPSITGLTGATMVAPVGTTRVERDAAIDNALKTIQKPTSRGTLISASENSPYALEILVGPDPGPNTPDLNNYHPRAAGIDRRNLAFVTIERGEVYAVRVFNKSRFDAAVTLTIDGLNMFAFSDQKSYEFVVVPAGSEAVIVGWHRDNDRSDAFQVSEYSKSAVFRKMPNSSSIGTIHASFRAAWPVGTTPPSDEFPPGSRDSSATARGAEVRAQFTEVTRQYGQLREAISVRYNKQIEPSDLPDSRPAK